MRDCRTPSEIVHAAMRMRKRRKVGDGTQVTNENIMEGESNAAEDDEDVSKANKPRSKSRFGEDEGGEIENGCMITLSCSLDSGGRLLKVCCCITEVAL